MRCRCSLIWFSASRFPGLTAAANYGIQSSKRRQESCPAHHFRVVGPRCRCDGFFCLLSCAHIASDHLDWISKSLADALAAAPPSLNIDLRLHVTGASAPTVALRLDKATPSRPSSSYDFWIEKARVSVTALAFSEIVQASAPVAPVLRGRPDIGAILREAMDGAAGPVSVDGECSFVDALHFIEG
jgi:hypothetical protein